MPPPPPDTAPLDKFVAGAFTRGHAFRTHDGGVKVRPRKAGDLVLTSGRIILADPGWIADDRNRRPLARRVPPGRYPVWLSVAAPEERKDFLTVECVKLSFSDAAPARWEPGHWEGDDPAALPPGRHFVYPVETATACFTDADNVPTREAAEQLQQKTTTLGGLSAKLLLDRRTGANLVQFDTGHGDGSCACWWGLDRRGKPVCLVTEFGLLAAVQEYEEEGDFDDLDDEDD